MGAGEAMASDAAAQLDAGSAEVARAPTADAAVADTDVAVGAGDTAETCTRRMYWVDGLMFHARSRCGVCAATGLDSVAVVKIEIGDDHWHCNFATANANKHLVFIYVLILTCADSTLSNQ